ncbi:MAG TPA: hypothetical protein VFM87_08725 [Agrococcus sp.]|nr:hypothetical protein [Agrococcus sp.]
MIRSTYSAALTLIAVLALAACSSGSPPEPSTASDPTPAPAAVVETEAPAESEAPEPTGDGEAEGDAVLARCEMLVQERFADEGVRLATADDIAAVAEALTMPVLPGRATCGGVMDDEAYTQLIWVDQPLVAPALLEVLGSRGWETSEEQATGYTITGYDEGTFVVSVAPIGVDNVASAWGGIWPGMDVTILGFERR